MSALKDPTQEELKTAFLPRLSDELDALQFASAQTTADRRPVELDQQSVGRLSRMDAMAFNRGDLWMLVAVAVWAAYSLLLKRRPPELPPTVALAGSMATGVALMLPVFLAVLPMAHLAVNTGLVGAMAYIVVFPSVLAFWLWGYGVGRLGPERAGQFVHLMPVFGPVLAMAILGEQVVLPQLAGAVVIFAGIVLVIRRPVG